ncbi:MAG: AraC family transcriptional regulator [Acetobacteraceae bacterium]
MELYWAGGQGWHDITEDQPALTLIFEEIGGRYDLRTSLEQPSRSRQGHQRSITLMPAGTQLWGYANNTRYVRCARITFDTVALAEQLGDRVAAPKIDMPRLMSNDDHVWQIGSLLAAECAKPNGTDQVYGDSLAAALCTRLLKQQEPVDREPARGGLAPWQLRRLTEYMETSLSDTIRLKDLADLAGLSLSHLGRAFRQSTGMPPHRWHLNARIRRAQELLLETELPLADIALSTGFADQSHFTKSFHRQVGASPGAWRRQRQN